jgi:MFS family permease
MPAAAQVERAIRFSYAQMMFNAVFAASTGGMFLIGFAIQLGADNVLLGLMITLPQFFVVFQFLAAWLIERGISRRRLTIAFAFVTPLCWLLIATLPLLGANWGRGARFGMLIGVMTLVTLAAQFAANARASWVGELIPAERRGRFFGYCTMFAGIVGALFAIGEGRFLDAIRARGLTAFTALFFFGSLFGLLTAALNVPQPDCPLPNSGQPISPRQVLRDMVRNRPFITLALVHAVIAFGGIAGPFNPAYCLRDVGVSFFGLGLLNAVGVTASLLMGPVWGKLVDRFGCRPILILGLLIMAPCSAVWLAIPPGHPQRAYWLLPWTNFIAGSGGAALGVAISTMMYKLSKPEGRSIQFAAYSTFVGVLSAPMPLLGGWLVSKLTAAGYAIDLRLTFLAWSVFMFAAAGIALRLHEPGSITVPAFVFNYFPARLAGIFGINLAPMNAPFTPTGRFQGKP